MGLKITTRKVLALAAGLLLLLLYHFSTPDPSRITIRLHDDQIDIQKLTNAISEYIIEEGYGYKVEKVESTIKEVHGRLIRGDIDITLEMWKANNLVWFDNARNEGRIVDLGPIYSQGRQYWIIPRWYAEEKGIKTVFDMKGHWQDFQDPEDPSKGLFFNCIFGWACRDINRVKLAAYGLDRYFNMVSPTSPKALKSIYENARARHLPVFGYYWEPNALMTNQDWHRLEEPPYDKAIWYTIISAAADAQEDPLESACAYDANTVHKIANSRLLEKAPDVADMFKKMEIPVALFNDILFQKESRHWKGDALEDTALFFLNQYRDYWGAWVTPGARKKIIRSLSGPRSTDA